MLTASIHAPHCQPVGQTKVAPAAASRLTRIPFTPQCVQLLVARTTSPSVRNEPFGSATTCGNRLLGSTIGVR